MKPELVKNEQLLEKPTLQRLHEIVRDWAEEEFERRGTVTPMFIIQSGRSVMWVNCLWESDDEERATLAVIKSVLHSTMADAYSFVVEAFVAAARSPQEAAEYESRGLRNLPTSKRDSIMLQTTHARVKEFIGCAWLINEARDNLRQTLGVRQDDYFDHLNAVSAQMLDLFDNFEKVPRREAH